MRDENTVLARRLRELREAHGLSLRQAGALAGIHWTYIGKLERGEKGTPSYIIVKALATIYDVSPEDLMEPTE